MMADLAAEDVAVLAPSLARSISASVRPAPKAPTCRKLRREMPSQNFCRFPHSVSIGRTPQKGVKALPVRGGERGESVDATPADAGKQLNSWQGGRFVGKC